MQRAAIPTTGGQYTNVDEFASGRPGQIVNLMPDEAGTLTSRPGLLSFSTPTDAATPDVPAPSGTDPNPQGVIGLAAYGDYLIMVKRNRRIFRVDSSGTALDITDRKLGGNSVPTFLELSDGSLLIMGGGEPVAVDKRIRAVPFGEFKDGSRPRVTHGAIVDRQLVVNEKNTDHWYTSRYDDQTVFMQEYTEAIKGEAGGRADNISAMIGYRNTVFMFGERSCEIWYGTGSADAPLRMDANPPQTSLIAPRSLVLADETLWWLDRERRINRLEGRQAKVKSLAVENQLRQLSYPEDCVAHNVEIAGHHLVTFTFERDEVTLVYDYVLDAWTEWRRWKDSPRSAGTWNSMPMDAYAYHPKWNKHYCGGAEAGTIYELSQTTYQDNSQPLRRLWRGPVYDHGTMLRKRNRRYTFLLDGGTASTHTTTAEGYDPRIEVRWRDESRRWKTKYVSVHIGKIGNIDTTRDLWRCGEYQRRQLEWQCSAPVALRVNRIEEEYDQRSR